MSPSKAAAAFDIFLAAAAAVEAVVIAGAPAGRAAGGALALPSILYRYRGRAIDIRLEIKEIDPVQTLMTGSKLYMTMMIDVACC